MNSDNKKFQARDKITILVAEDEENVRNLYTTVLGEEGHKVFTASNGAEAIEKFEKEVFDLLILDLKMPDIHGIEILKLIKKKLEGVSVIIVTAYPSLESSIEAIKLGVYDYIIKPFGPKQLKLVIKRAVEKIRLIREKEHLLRKLEERNKRLEENVDTLEDMANAAMAREKELEKKVKDLEAEVEKLKGLKK